MSQPATAVLFVPYEAAQMELFIMVAQALRLSGNTVPIIYCPYALPGEREYRRRCIEAGIEYLQEHTAEGGEVDLQRLLDILANRYSEPLAQVLPNFRPADLESSKQLKGHVNLQEALRIWSQLSKKRAAIRKVLQEWCTHLPPEILGTILEDFRLWMQRYQRKLQFGRELARRMRLGAIILGEHIAERDSGVWLRVAAENGLVAIVLAQHIISKRATFDTYIENPEYWVSNAANAIFLRYFPRWRFDIGPSGLVRLPAPMALAQEWWGVALSSPWDANGVPCNGVWVESRWLADQYIREGVGADCISVTGSPHLDKLFVAIASPIYGPKSEIWHELGIDKSRPLIVVALPSNLYPQRRSEIAKTYEDLILCYVQALRALKHVSYICALHPSTGEHVIRLLKSLNVTYVLGKLAEVLPHARLYLCSASSTISWALACGIPVINFDVYQLHHQVGEPIHGVHTIQTVEELIRWLEIIDFHFAPGSSAVPNQKLSDLEHCARKHAAYYGQVDGRCTERILAGIYELMRRRMPVCVNRQLDVRELRECSELLRSLG